MLIYIISCPDYKHGWLKRADIAQSEAIFGLIRIKVLSRFALDLKSLDRASHHFLVVGQSSESSSASKNLIAESLKSLAESASDLPPSAARVSICYAIDKINLLYIWLRAVTCECSTWCLGKSLSGMNCFLRELQKSIDSKGNSSSRGSFNAALDERSSSMKTMLPASIASTNGGRFLLFFCKSAELWSDCWFKSFLRTDNSKTEKSFHAANICIGFWWGNLELMI